MREDKLILACRMIGGTLLAGVFAVATGLIESRTYLNEVEYTRESREEAKRFKQHRCNDRLADMLEVRPWHGSASASAGMQHVWLPVVVTNSAYP